MEFRDLKTQYKTLKEEIDKSVMEVMSDANFISGRQVKELEEELASYVGVKHCITCANGTDALSMMLMAWDIKEGDAVFVPDFTFFATAEVVSFEGATPVFYDVKEDTFNTNIDSLINAIESVKREGLLKARAIIAVDLFGQPADYDKLEAVAKKYDLLLLEDSAQGFGGMIGDRRACSFGDAATTSFFPAKPLGCYGDGGAIFTNDDKVNEYLRSIAVHGKGMFKYDNVRIGWNSRLDTIQAAILKVKLNAFKEYELVKVNEAANKYTELLKNIVETPKVPENFYSSWAQYTIKLKSKEERDSLKEYLSEKGIPTMVYYPKTMSQQEVYKGIKKYEECTMAKKLTEVVLALPMHPYLFEEDIKFISNTIVEFEKHRVDKSY